MVFKKIVASVMAVATLALAFAGCGKKESKKFVVGFDQEFPPMGFVADDGSYVGFDLDLAKEAAKRMGKEFVAQPIAWDSKDQELATGNIDCIWNGFTMNGREDSYTFSVPYVDNSQVIVTAEDAGITSLEDLEGKIVGVQADSAALALLDEGGDQEELGATFGEMQQFADYNTAFAELQAGSLDAIAIDVGVANYQIAGREGYVILDEYLNSEQYAVGFKKGNDALCQIINEDLEVLLESGMFDEIAAKYEESGIPSDMLCLAESLGYESETEAE